ncbi:MAG: gluconate 2-dehydrogenase subunit 3 family protein [Vicinamibacterales bacterium]
MTTRRYALKMLGTIGLTCAFPFEGDELYGQHVHLALTQTPATGPYVPAFFTPAEYATLSRLTDVIIPPTTTPGAVGAGVPEYIDRVVAGNAEHQPLVRTGLAWLEQQAKTRFSKDFLTLSESEHVAILQPLSDEIDRQRRQAQRQRFRTEGGATVYYAAVTDRTQPTPSPAATRPAVSTDGGDPEMPLRLFRLIKNLTADGYYTSRIGLLQELGYTGNTFMARYPTCSVPEH